MEGGMDKKEDHPDLPSQDLDRPLSSFSPKGEE
jgi:hypothetical protein